jgi:hypothetical protein
MTRGGKATKIFGVSETSRRVMNQKGCWKEKGCGKEKEIWSKNYTRMIVKRKNWAGAKLCVYVKVECTKVYCVCANE